MQAYEPVHPHPQVGVYLSLSGDGSDGRGDPWLQTKRLGGDIDEAANFAYYAPPNLVNVSPTSSSVGIGQILTLRGSGFASGCGSAPTCRLGSATTAWETSAATVLSDGEVRCAAPRGTGLSEVQLSLNGGADFSGGDTPVRHTLGGQWHLMSYPVHPACRANAPRCFIPSRVTTCPRSTRLASRRPARNC